MERKYSVLLVDDEPAALSMVKRAIYNWAPEFEVVAEAFDVEHGKELCEQNQPDVVVTDMKMPHESGIEMVKHVCCGREKPGVCIVLSGFSDFEYVHDAFALGAFDYLLKPVAPKKLEELFHRIACVLDENAVLRKPAAAAARQQKGDKLVSEIDRHIRENLRGDHSILSICNTFGISQTFLSKTFKSCCNCTYNEYLTNLRIDEAKKLLQQRDTILIGDVAERVGFNGQFYFSKVFKNATGYSPRDYRSLYVKEETDKKDYIGKDDVQL